MSGASEVVRRLVGIALIAVSLAAAALYFRSRIPESSRRPPDVEEVYLPGMPGVGETGEPFPVFCFFVDRSLRLVSVSRTVRRSTDTAGVLRQAVAALLAGPGSGELLPVFPSGVRWKPTSMTVLGYAL